MSARRESKFSRHARASVRLTRRSAGFGKNTSSRSPTTSMDGSVAPGYDGSNRQKMRQVVLDNEYRLTGMKKKCMFESTAMREMRVLSSSFGIRSKDSRRVLAAVATMPVVEMKNISKIV